MGGTGSVADDAGLLAEARAGRAAEQRQETRASTLVGGAIALAALPAWGAFDWILVPDQARRFLVARLLSEVLVALLWALLWWRRTGTRWPEQLSLAMVLSIEVAIAWMVPRSGAQLEAYLLGFSLAVYATAFLITWRWWMGSVLVGVSALALTAFSLTAHPGLDAEQATTTAFYLLTASALALASQVYRERARWHHHLTQAELSRERRRSAVLMGELEQLSREDPLTSVGNRRAWDERVTAELLRSRRSGRPLSVLVCDLDRFKAVNDLGGHILGDSALRAAALVLSEEATPANFVARLGGDEFAVLCPDTSLGAAAALAGQVQSAIRVAPLLARLGMTCSIGAAELEDDDESTASLYRRADQAMYEAKVTRDALRCAEPGRQAARPALDRTV